MAVLSPSLPVFNLTQKHTAQLAGLRAAYALTFARRAPAPSPPLIAVEPVRETPLSPPALATAAETVLLYPASPAAAAAFRTAGLLAYAALCTTPPSPRATSASRCSPSPDLRNRRPLRPA